MIALYTPAPLVGSCYLMIGIVRMGKGEKTNERKASPEEG